MNYAFSLIVVMLLGVLSSCGTLSSEVTEKQQAESHLNAREYDQAIFLLDRLVKEHPQDDELKLLLSTAYSGSTGLNVIDAFQVFKPLIFKDERRIVEFEQNKTAALVIQNAEETPDHVEIKKKLIRFLDSLADGFTIVFNMPYSEATQRRKLVQAVLVLETIGTSSDYYLKAQHYSILLNVTQFLNFTKDAFPALKAHEKVKFSTLVCAFQPSTFFENLDKSLNYFTNAIKSYQVVRRADKKEPSPQFHKLYDSAIRLGQYYKEREHSSLVVDAVYKQLKRNYCQ